jgi:hypothetical protein
MVEAIDKFLGLTQHRPRTIYIDCTSPNLHSHFTYDDYMELGLARAIRSFQHIAARVATATSEDLQLFLDTAGKGWNSYDRLMSSENDEFWEDEMEALELDEDGRAQWAKDREREAYDSGDPSMHYDEATIVPDGTWLVHFTDANPYQIIKSGFKGRDLDIIALTTHYKDGTHPGIYALAYEADDVKGHGRDFGKYGKNAVLFQAKEAARSYHYGDEENQVVFINNTAYNMYPVFGDSDSLSLEDPKTGEVIAYCDRNQTCIDKFIDAIEDPQMRLTPEQAEEIHADVETHSLPRSVVVKRLRDALLAGEVGAKRAYTTLASEGFTTRRLGRLHFYKAWAHGDSYFITFTKVVKLTGTSPAHAIEHLVEKHGYKGANTNTPNAVRMLKAGVSLTVTPYYDEDKLVLQITVELTKRETLAITGTLDDSDRCIRALTKVGHLWVKKGRITLRTVTMARLAAPNYKTQGGDSHPVDH